MKNIVLIRHGESLGQTARERGKSRNDPSLLDCFLTSKGIRQAQHLGHALKQQQQQKQQEEDHGDSHDFGFDLVCVSPLTRALATCMLGFGHILEDTKQEGGVIPLDDNHACNNAIASTRTRTHTRTRTRIPFICHPGLAETGGSIPENHGRPFSIVISDIKKKLKRYDPNVGTYITHVDLSLLQPQQQEEGGGKTGSSTTSATLWPPSSHDEKLTRRDFLKWLHDRPEQNIAIVCHHNVIRTLLRYQVDSVLNCMPISCVMHEGHLDSFYLPGHDPMEYSKAEALPTRSRRRRQTKGKKKVTKQHS